MNEFFHGDLKVTPTVIWANGDVRRAWIFWEDDPGGDHVEPDDTPPVQLDEMLAAVERWFFSEDYAGAENDLSFLLDRAYRSGQLDSKSEGS